MKNANRVTRYILMFAIGAFAVSLVILASRANAETDEELTAIDKRIETYENAPKKTYEPETVSLSYEEYLEQKKLRTNLDTSASYQQVKKTSTDAASETFEPETWTSEQVNLDTMDVWQLGEYLYGIPAYDTTRSLILITFEGYGPESSLSYYVACCCWSRATENYWGYGNLYAAFGGADTWNYGEWLDSYGYADYAVDVLRQCYLTPMYVVNCNGMETPAEYIYYENGIYVWN